MASYNHSQPAQSNYPPPTQLQRHQEAVNSTLLNGGSENDHTNRLPHQIDTAGAGNTSNLSSQMRDNKDDTERHPAMAQPLTSNNESTLRRALNANQITMITLGGTFGTGLLVGTGTGLNQGGPLGLLLSFLFIGSICYCMMSSLCEMATYLPHKKGFIGFVSRYVHQAVGFGLGWTYLCHFLFVPASHINTASIVMEYIAYVSDPAPGQPPIGAANPIPAWAWRLIFIFFVVAINCFPIRAFGRIEFWLSSLKIVALIGLILFGIIVDSGGARNKSGEHKPIGFKYWGGEFGPMGHLNLNTTESTNTFLGFWATMVRALFAYMGIELLGVVIGESENPRKAVPRAIKQTFILVAGLYIFGVIIIGLICPSNDDAFSTTDHFPSREGQMSPFGIAAKQLAARGIVPTINAIIIIFALSAASSNVYTASRILYGLALDGQAPGIFRKVTNQGMPLFALGAASACIFLTYIGLNETTEAFHYFVDLTTTAVISWICILWAHIRFRRILAAHGEIDKLPYNSPVYPYGTWFALIAISIFVIFKGHESYVKRGPGGFICAYILIPFFAILSGAWKLYHRDFQDKETMYNELQNEKQWIDEEEEEYKRKRRERGELSWRQKLGDYI